MPPRLSALPIVIYIRTCTTIGNLRGRHIQNKDNTRDREARHRIQITDERWDNKYEMIHAGGEGRWGVGRPYNAEKMGRYGTVSMLENSMGETVKGRARRW